MGIFGKAVGTAALLVCVAGHGVARAEPAAGMSLTPDQTRALAVAAHNQHQPALARDLALVLLERDPRDSLALQILAASYFALGDFDASAAAGRRAYGAAQSRQHSHDAAMIVAETQFRRGRIGAARLWLRRAVQYSQTPQERDLAIRAFQGIGTQQKLKSTLSFGVSPSSNINGGSSSDTLILFGIPFTLSGDAQALSGFEAHAGASLAYTLSESARHQTSIGANVESRAYALSDAAKAQAPTASAGDYAFTAIEAFVTHRFAPEGATGPVTLTFVAGHNWYGGDDLSDYLRTEAAREWRLSQSMGLQVSGALERQWRKDSATRSATVQSVNATLVQVLRNGDRLTYGLGARNTDAHATDTRHQAVTGSIGYAFGRPVLGVALSANLGIEARDYALSPYSPDGRHDLRVNGTLSVLLPKLSYLGFAPQIDLNATRTDSNISLYQSSDVGIGISFRSAF